MIVQDTRLGSIGCTVGADPRRNMIAIGLGFVSGVAVSRRQRLHRRDVVVCSLDGDADGRGAKNAKKKVLIVGGTGRIGSSICQGLLKRAVEEKVELDICIAGRNEKLGAQLARKDASVRFKKVDITLPGLVEFVQDFDLIVHAAGPFQQKERAEVLEAAIEAGVNYQDVCDDVAHMKISKELDAAAKRRGTTNAICAGIYPGASNLMAALAIRDLSSPVQDLHYGYYTAGTGGAGATILSSTFLLVAEDVITFKDGKEDLRRAATGMETIDFGVGVEKHKGFLMNLPEVISTAETFRVPNASARFSLSPQLWTDATRLMAWVVPRQVLRNRALIARFSNWIDPVVRKVDQMVGAATAIRVDAVSQEGEKVTFLYAHEDLVEATGIATAAFTWHLLFSPNLPKGVLYPEELFDSSAELFQFLTIAAQGAFNWQRQDASGVHVYNVAKKEH